MAFRIKGVVGFNPSLNKNHVIGSTIRYRVPFIKLIRFIRPVACIIYINGRNIVTFQLNNMDKRVNETVQLGTFTNQRFRTKGNSKKQGKEIKKSKKNENLELRSARICIS